MNGATFTIDGLTLDSIEKTANFLKRGLTGAHKAVILTSGDGTFRFLFSRNFDLKKYQRATGFYVVSSRLYHEEFRIGHGLYSPWAFSATIHHNVSEERAAELSEAITQYFEQHPPTVPGPVDMRSFKDNEDVCYYMYDYLPKSRDQRWTADDKKTALFLYAFKDGKNPVHTAKLVSMAIWRNRYLLDDKRPLLCVIPASNEDKHQIRYEVFCKELAKKLHIEDGCYELYPNYEREPSKGRRWGLVLDGVTVDADRVKGRDIILFDDVYNSGRNYREACELLREGGAGSITGVFLCKTVAR